MKHEEAKRDKQEDKKAEAPAEAKVDATDPPANEDVKVAKLHVGRLSRNVNKGHLEEIFAHYGTVKAVDVIIVRCNRHKPMLSLVYSLLRINSPTRRADLHTSR